MLGFITAVQKRQTLDAEGNASPLVHLGGRKALDRSS